MNTIELLLSRRSVVAADMTGPGPDADQVQTILQCAHRVPDHGKLGPWRFVVFSGDARTSFGRELADIYARNHPDVSEKLLDYQANLLNRAPVVIAVISTAESHIKIPEWEQIMSAGAACQNMLVAANALGFGAQWLTEWYGYDEAVKSLLGAQPHHKIAGFIYIGNYVNRPDERKRPDLAERVTTWQGNA